MGEFYKRFDSASVAAFTIAADASGLYPDAALTDEGRPVQQRPPNLYAKKKRRRYRRPRFLIQTLILIAYINAIRRR
jgi:hypothetical protein